MSTYAEAVGSLFSAGIAHGNPVILATGQMT